jgi:tetratricopeptide (TPR) repeat protein
MRLIRRLNLMIFRLLLAIGMLVLISSSVCADETATTKQTVGQPLLGGTGVEDLKATYDVDLARKQVEAYPDNPDAHFILAVALTRTNFMEQALKEIQTARRLAEARGGPAYFDKTINTYEEVLKNFPEENEVRYGLAWAYYMKAYLVAKHYQREQKALAARSSENKAKTDAHLSSAHQSSDVPWELSAVAGGTTINELGSAGANIGPAKPYYQAALNKMDELLQRDPLDVWTIIYRAFLQAQYTGQLNEAMDTWRQCLNKFPGNPVPYFFLGEGYLKQGNLKESLQNISKAVSLRVVPTQ